MSAPVQESEPQAPVLTGMAEAVVSEVATLAAAHADGGAGAAIELTAMPLTVADRAAIRDRLGRGEVEARVESAGRSEVWETAYSGVWIVRHFGDDERVASETIEIAAVPQILAADPADRRAAARRLARDIAAPPPPAAPDPIRA